MIEGTLDFDPDEGDLAKVASLASLIDQQPTIPGYELDKRIGEGSFGEVWSATQLSTGQRVAVKILHRTDLNALVYLEREVSRLANVTEHPNLLTLIDANLHHVPAFLVTPLLAGSLDAFRDRPVATAQVVSWLQQVAEALVFIHNRGILHCDLKPPNLLQDQEGRVRLVDFGQAHLLEQSGTSLGTLWFMPAEQVPTADRQVHPEPGWDIYALGATFYWLLTSRHPHETDAGNQTISSLKDPRTQLDEYRRQLRAQPLIPLRQLNPAVDRDLAAIVERCLHPNPEQRYRAAADVLADLERRRKRYPVLARPQTPGYKARRLLARHWGLALMASLILMGLVATATELNLTKAELRRHSTQRTLAASSQLASAGSTQPELKLAAACALRPHDLALRLQFSAYLRTQWYLRYQIQGRGSQVLVTPDGAHIVFINSVQPGRVQIFDGHDGHLVGDYDQGKLLRNCRLSPRGDRLICPDVNGRVIARGMRGGEETWATHNGAASCAVLSNDGLNCLSASVRGQVLWTRRKREGLEWSHPQAVNDLTLSPDLRWAGSGSEDGSVQWWDLPGRRRVALWSTGSPVQKLAWCKSPPGCLVGCRDGRILRYSVSGDKLGEMSHGDQLVDLREQSNGQVLSWGGSRCRLWDATGRLVQDFVQRESFFSTAALSHDGRLLITGDEDGLAQIWDVATAVPAYRSMARPGRLSEVGFFPGDEVVYTASSTIDIWDLTKMSRLPSRLMHGSGRINDFVWHPKGDWLACAQESRLWLWNEHGSPIGDPVETQWEAFTVTVDEDGRLLAQSGSRLRLYEAGPKGLQLLRYCSIAPRIRISNNGRWACNGNSVFPLDDTEKGWKVDPSSAQYGVVADDGQSLALLVAGQLSVWGPAGIKTSKIPQEAPVLARFTPHGLLWVTAKATTLYDPELDPLWTRATPTFDSPPGSAQFLALRRIHARCDNEARSVLVFNYQKAEWLDVRTGSLRHQIPVVGRVGDACWSPDGNWVGLSSTQGVYLFHPSMSECTPVPLAPLRTQSPMSFRPGPLVITLARANYLVSYPLDYDSKSTPDQLRDQAVARVGRGLLGETEWVVDAKALEALRQRLLQGPSYRPKP